MNMCFCTTKYWSLGHALSSLSIDLDINLRILSQGTKSILQMQYALLPNLGTRWCLFFNFVSSEGALIAITPYDYPRRQQPLFEHTPVLDNNLNINAMMTLVTMITIKTEITKTKSAASVA